MQAPEYSEAVFKIAGRDIRHHCVNFMVEDGCAGSGTLASIAGRRGILTAAHVFDGLEKQKWKVGLVFGRGLQHFQIPWSKFAITYYRPNREERKEGPDLAFLEILDPDRLTTLAAKMSFWSISEERLQQLEKLDLNSVHLIVAGQIGEFSGPLSEADDAVWMNAHLQANADWVETNQREDGSDWMVLRVKSGSGDHPKSFGGMSGGGVWAIGYERLGTIYYPKPFLVGVPYFQEEPVGDKGAMHLSCEGVRSIYQALRVAEAPSILPGS